MIIKDTTISIDGITIGRGSNGVFVYPDGDEYGTPAWATPEELRLWMAVASVAISDEPMWIPGPVVFGKVDGS